jgi:hypothetical protein
MIASVVLKAGTDPAFFVVEGKTYNSNVEVSICSED